LGKALIGASEAYDNIIKVFIDIELAE